MPKPTLSDVLDVADPMLSDNFDLTFASIPGGGNNKKFTIQCKTAMKPGTSIQEVEIELFGHKVMHAAKRTWTNELALEFVEDNKGTITKALEDWSEKIRKTETQHGDFKKDYAVDAVFKIYDQKGEVAMEYKLINCWPSQVPDLQFDGTGGTAISVAASFKFDHVERTRP